MAPSFRSPVIPALAALVVASSLFLSACGDQATAPVEPNVMEILVQIPELSILTGLIQDAGLQETIASESPITLFAPLNDAFEGVALEGGEADAINSLLLYHVANEAAPSWQLTDGRILETLQQESFVIRIEERRGFIGEAEIVAIDGIGLNGIVHIIDGVLIPPSFRPEDDSPDT